MDLCEFGSGEKKRERKDMEEGLKKCSGKEFVSLWTNIHL